jgi:WhiB family redox-sensing transcriptional regulator
MQDRSAVETARVVPSPSAASAPHGYVPSAPENWFVDPVRLGVPGVRQPDRDEQLVDNPLAWQSDSLCAQTDPEAFFPEKGGSTRDAKKICASCEVRVHCLEYALENDERFGIWGGLSERERRKLRKRA